MLAPSEMMVVFVLNETISLGRKLTADELLRLRLRKEALKVPQRRIY
jgi:hypothetical protein